MSLASERSRLTSCGGRNDEDARNSTGAQFDWVSSNSAAHPEEFGAAQVASAGPSLCDFADLGNVKPGTPSRSLDGLCIVGGFACHVRCRSAENRTGEVR